MHGVVQVAPLAAGLGGIVGLQLRQHRHHVIVAPQARTRGQHHRPVLGLAFVHPQLVVVHRRVVMRYPTRAWAPRLADPRMGVFVRQQVVVGERPLAAQVAFVHAVLAALRMFQADAAEHVGYRQQEVIARIRAGAEYPVGLAYQRAVGIQHLGVGLQGLRILGQYVQPHRLRGLVIQRETLEPAPGVDRRIDQGHQRHRRIAFNATIARGHVQRGTAVPSLRQAQAGPDPDAACIHPGRVQQHPVPLQVEQVGSHRHPALFRGSGRQVLEFDVQRRHALGHLQVEGIHVLRIAAPAQGLAVAANQQAGHLVDRPGRRMVAGYPLRVPQGQWPGRHRDALMHALDAPLHVAGIHLQLDHAGIVGLQRRRRLDGPCLHAGHGQPAQHHCQPPRAHSHVSPLPISVATS